MKKPLLLIAFSFVVSLTFAQTISADSVKYYDGKTITVCSKIVETHVSSSDKKTTHLNFEYGYPNQTFTGIIFEDDLAKFSYVPAEFLKDKKVCVTGKVKLYKERPEIIINSEKQIRIQ